MTRQRLHVCLLCARGTGRVSQPRACREARGQAERTVSAEPSVSSTPVRVVNSSRLSCFVAYLVAYSSAEKWSMSGLKSTLARCESCTHLLRNDTCGASLSHREWACVEPHDWHSYRHQCATQPKLWSVSSLATSAIGASSPPSDGLPQRGILLVHGVRARRGGVAREGEGAQFDSDPQERGSDCKFGCRGIALHATEKGSVCSWHIFHLEEMGLLGWASNYASPGLLFWIAEGPAPRHLQGRHAGG